jgi:hypothetical protein
MSHQEQDENVDYLRSELCRLDVEINQMLKTCAEAGEGFAVHYLGSIATEESPAPDRVLSFLCSSEPGVRQAAFGVLSDKQIQTEQSLQAAEEAIRGDPELLVRTSAIRYLARCFDASRSEYYSRFFATVVADQSQPETVRLTAYKGLIYLHDLSIEWVPSIAMLRFPDDVDWSFVSRWLGQ